MKCNVITARENLYSNIADSGFSVGWYTVDLRSFSTAEKFFEINQASIIGHSTAMGLKLEVLAIVSTQCFYLHVPL